MPIDGLFARWPRWPSKGSSCKSLLLAFLRVFHLWLVLFVLILHVSVTSVCAICFRWFDWLWKNNSHNKTTKRTRRHNSYTLSQWMRGDAEGESFLQLAMQQPSGFARVKKRTRTKNSSTWNRLVSAYICNGSSNRKKVKKQSYLSCVLSFCLCVCFYPPRLCKSTFSWPLTSSLSLPSLHSPGPSAGTVILTVSTERQQILWLTIQLAQQTQQRGQKQQGQTPSANGGEGCLFVFCVLQGFLVYICPWRRGLLPCDLHSARGHSISPVIRHL